MSPASEQIILNAGWHRLSTLLPPKGVVVEVMTSSGDTGQLKLVGRLWFMPDGSMYVYYTPEFWREIQP